LLLADYLKKVPAIYAPYLTNIFRERGYNRHIALRHNDRALVLNDTMEKMQNQLRKSLADSYKINLKAHSEYTSGCCPIYSQAYEEWSRSISKYKETSVFKRSIKNNLNIILKLKSQLFPEEQDEIGRVDIPSKPVIKGINYNFSLEVSENERYMDMGNPFRKTRNSHRSNGEPTV
jgi:hypothetical protein